MESNLEPQSASLVEIPSARMPFSRWLLHVPSGERNFYGMLKWWEQRRFAYNVLVLLSFIPGFIVTGHRWGPLALPLMWIYGVCSVPYLIFANICYTGGCISEYAQKRFFPPAALRLGPTLFLFGCILTAIGTAIFAIVMGLTSMLLPIQTG